jgi:hypothetical protein
MVFNYLIIFSWPIGVGNRSLLACGNAPEEGNVLISVVALHCLAGAVTGSVFCRAHAFDPGGARFDGVRWGDDRVGHFLGALVAGKPNRGSGRLSWRCLPS